MACCQSLAARRLLLWYNLLGSIVILALSWDYSMGCRMILVEGPGPEASEHGYGLFHTAVYDYDGTFLGCVNHSKQVLDEMNHGEFKAARWFAVLILIAVTLTAFLSIFVQCFSKSGKSFLWQVLGWTYAFALAFQILVLFFTIRSSYSWEELTGDASKSSLGPDTVVAIFNLAFLFGIVLAVFVSLPPRNPVFRFWNVITSEYDTDNQDTDDEASDPENPKKGKDQSNDRSKRSGSEENDAVSLFSSQRSKRSRNSESDSKKLFPARSSSRNSGRISRASGRSGALSKVSVRSEALSKTSENSNKRSSPVEQDDSGSKISKAQSKTSSKSGSRASWRDKKSPSINEQDVTGDDAGGDKLDDDDMRIDRAETADEKSKASGRQSIGKLSSNGSKNGSKPEIIQTGDDQSYRSISSGSDNVSKPKSVKSMGSKSSSKKNGSSSSSTSQVLDTLHEDEEERPDDPISDNNTQKGSIASAKVSTGGSTKGSNSIRSKSLISGSNIPAQTNRSSSQGIMREDPWNFDALADGLSTVKSLENTVKSSLSATSRHSGRNSTTKSTASARTSSSRTTGSINTAKFLRRLKESTKIEKGGFRRSETVLGQKLEIIDEYPATTIDGIHPPHDLDGTDIVKVRTEYYPEGRKTIKEELHHDGSRTVSTLIEPLHYGEGVEVGIDGAVE